MNILIAVTTPNISNLVTLYQQETGKSLTRKIDEYAPQLGKLARYIAMLSNISHEEIRPLDALKQAVTLLEHIHLSFVIITDEKTHFKLLQLCKLSVTINGDFGIYSGSLYNWKQTCIECLQLHHSKKVREEFSAILSFFDQNDLSYIFSDYRKYGSNDGTLLLEAL